MTVSRNVQVAASFLGLNLLLSIYDFALGLKPHEPAPAAPQQLDEHGHPVGHADAVTDHASRYPHFIQDALPVLENVVVPAVILLAALSIAGSLLGRRAGLYGMLAVGVITVAWNAPDFVWHLQAGEELHSVVCVVGVIMGLVVARYAWLAVRESPVRERIDAVA